MQRRELLMAVGAGGVLAAQAASAAQAGANVQLSASELAAQMVAGKTSSVKLLDGYIKRIEALDRRGPTLNSVMELNPDAKALAKVLDDERRAGKVRGPLHGLPVLLKDNIATGDRMATTAGSLALDGVSAARDAHVVKRLREAGALIMGKTNLSEWANIRSTRSTSGWSARGGLTRNPYALDRNTSGSSSGSATAIAADLAAFALGSETDGSIVSPASIGGLVGLKPTVGLVSRDGIIPISHTQDTAGPMTRTVADCALLLSGMVGKDTLDEATHKSPGITNYVNGLKRDALKGVRLGVAREYFTGHAGVDALIDKALLDLKRLGAEVVDAVPLPKPSYGEAEFLVLLTEFKADLAKWLKAFAPGAKVQSLADVIAFNEMHRNREMPHFAQELFAQAQGMGGLDGAAYLKALQTCQKGARDDGLDRVLTDLKLDALIAPTGGVAWLSDYVLGDNPGSGFSTPAAVAGYPHLTVPAGFVAGLPVGLSFVGPAWSEAKLLAYGFAFEQATMHRRPPAFAARTALV